MSEQTPLVDAQTLAAWLPKIGHAGMVDRAPEAAETADLYLREYCTRLPDPPPLVVCKVALSLAVRLAANPSAMKTASTEGQSVNYPPVGLTFFESILVGRYRRKSA